MRLRIALAAVLLGSLPADYRTVQEAINTAPQTLTSANQWVIRVKDSVQKRYKTVKTQARVPGIVTANNPDTW